MSSEQSAAFAACDPDEDLGGGEAGEPDSAYKVYLLDSAVMAMRTVARSWPGASQARALLRSGRHQQQGRAYASEEGYTGKGLEEKEKAAENRYIRQMEHERNLKKASGEASAHSAGQSPVGTPGKVTSGDEAASGGFRNTAVVAGLVAVVAGFWLLSGSGSSKKEDKEST